MSKLNYLFLCIPDPSNEFIKFVDKLFFNFIWNNKPEKIKRSTLCMDYNEGGLKMLDTKNQLSALKLTWIRRLLKNPNSDYNLLASYNIKSLDRLLQLGPLYCKMIMENISNKFWLDILDNWRRIVHNLGDSPESCFISPLWYNPKLPKETIFLPHCYRAGIQLPVDLCNSKGEILTLSELNQTYAISLNFLDYYRLRLGYYKLKKVSDTSQILQFEKPIWPSTQALIHRSEKGCKDFYNLLQNKNESKLLHTKKWEKILKTDIKPNEWIRIHSICFKTVNEIT